MVLYQNFFESPYNEDFGNEISWDLNFIKAMKSKYDRLNYLLVNAKEPLQAETMIRLIWEEELSEQTLSRLRKLISLYAKKNNVKVISSRQSYRLDKK